LKKEKPKKKETYFKFRNCKEYGFVLENYSFQLLLKIPLERILFLFKAIIFEQKIIIVMENYKETAILIESLLSLLSPL
jgi:hypothetical protein